MANRFGLTDRSIIYNNGQTEGASVNKSKMPFIVVLGAIFASDIQAQEIPAEFLACASLDDDTERLSCFDREMTRQLLASREQPAITATSDAAAATAVATTATAVTAKATHQEADSSPASIPQEPAAAGPAGASAALLSVAAANTDIPEAPAAAVPAQEPPTVAAATVAEEQFGSPRPAELEQISLTVTRVGRRPHGEHIVYLDNGQVWSEQTKSSYFPVKAGETVTIKKRKYGGYRLVTESGKAYDVERLR